MGEQLDLSVYDWPAQSRPSWWRHAHDLSRNRIRRQHLFSTNPESAAYQLRNQRQERTQHHDMWVQETQMPEMKAAGLTPSGFKPLANLSSMRGATHLENPEADRSFGAKEPEAAFSGGWQDSFLTEMTGKHRAIDRDAALNREAKLERIDAERKRSFEDHRQSLEKEYELVRGVIKPTVKLKDIGYYQQSGMTADNPYLHVADSVINWKQSLAGREADLAARSRIENELVERQKYIEAGLKGRTPALV